MSRIRSQSSAPTSEGRQQRTSAQGQLPEIVLRSPDRCIRSSGNLLLNMGGIAEGGNANRHIASDYAPRSDQSIVANRHSRQNDSAGANPDIASNLDWRPNSKPDARSAGFRGWSAVRICTPRPILHSVANDHRSPG